MPRLPRKTKIDDTKCHTCHAKPRWMSRSATPARRSEGGCRQAPRLPRKVPRHHRRPSAPKRATKASPVPQVPHLPSKTKVDVTKCHACHGKGRSMPPSATPATRNQGGCHQAPATPNQGGCHQAPRLPRKVPRRHRRPRAPKRAPKRATKASSVP